MNNFAARTDQFISRLVEACAGDVLARQQVSVLIGQLMTDEAARPLAESLMQIVVGDRNRARLTEGLQGEPLLLINRILDQFI